MPDANNTRRPVTVWLTPMELANLDTIAQTEQRSRSKMAGILLAEAINYRHDFGRRPLPPTKDPR